MPDKTTPVDPQPGSEAWLQALYQESRNDPQLLPPPRLDAAILEAAAKKQAAAAGARRLGRWQRWGVGFASAAVVLLTLAVFYNSPRLDEQLSLQRAAPAEMSAEALEQVRDGAVPAIRQAKQERSERELPEPGRHAAAPAEPTAAKPAPAPPPAAAGVAPVTDTDAPAVAAAPPAAPTQEALIEEVIVTARYRADTSADVPVTKLADTWGTVDMLLPEIDLQYRLQLSDGRRLSLGERELRAQQLSTALGPRDGRYADLLADGVAIIRLGVHAGMDVAAVLDEYTARIDPARPPLQPLGEAALLGGTAQLYSTGSGAAQPRSLYLLPLDKTTPAVLSVEVLDAAAGDGEILQMLRLPP